MDRDKIKLEMEEQERERYASIPPELIPLAQQVMDARCEAVSTMAEKHRAQAKGETALVEELEREVERLFNIAVDLGERLREELGEEL
jgi:hypothetical protein